MNRLFNMLMDENDSETPGSTGDAVPTEEITEEGNEEEQEEEEVSPTEEQQEIDRLKKENEKLKQSKQAETQKITSATLENFSDEQWESIEEKTGKPRAEIRNECKNWELTNRQNAFEAKSNVTEAIQDELEKNPKLIKLRSGIKEYLNGIPMDRKLNADLLAKEVENAIHVARSKYGELKQKPTVNKTKAKTPDKLHEEDNTMNEDYKEGEVEPGVYVSKDGLKINVGGKIDKKTWKSIQHEDEGPNSILFPTGFDKEPDFSK